MQELIPPKRGCKVRVTHERDSKTLLAMIVKARVADLNLYLPECPLDCRISINLEMDWDGDVEALQEMAAESTCDATPDRGKDRLSYSQSHYSVDLTQVTSTLPAQNVSLTLALCQHGAMTHGALVQKNQREEKEHELEIEVDTRTLIEQGRRVLQGQPHQYPELVEGFIDNVRMLARRAKSFPQ